LTKRAANGFSELPIFAKLARPTTEQDEAECLQLIACIRCMEIEAARFSTHHDRLAVIIRYSGGKAPAANWNKWLWCQIIPEGSDLSWLGRLAAIHRSPRQLVLVPRPDTIDVSLAENAKKTAASQPIHLALGLVYPPHQYMRRFPSIH
jgi:hypothetical protein